VRERWAERERERVKVLENIGLIVNERKGK